MRAANQPRSPEQGSRQEGRHRAWPGASIVLLVVACGSSAPGGSPSRPDGSAGGPLDASTGAQDAGGGASDDVASSVVDGANGGATDSPPAEAPDASGAEDSTPADTGAVAPPLDASGGTSPPDAGGCALEAIDVPGSGAAVATTNSLAADATYLLKAVGGVTAGGQRIDAEFAFSEGGMGSDLVAGTDVGIDVGLLWPNRPVRFTQTPPGPGRMKWNPVPQIDANNNVTAGALFRADGTYYMIAIGAGHPLSLKLVLPPMVAGSGSIRVTLYALSPAPAATYVPMHSLTPTPPPPPRTCGGALDTIDISAAAPTVAVSTFTTDATKLYLLQASGTAPTGAAGLGDGDAEYMDFGSTNSLANPYPLFNGYNDGEACADFGLGVDELTVGHCHVNTMCLHRKNWWGTVGVAPNTTTMYTSPTYRNDHVYYMIYPGTGKPISFMYFDSGYGDNNPPFDVLARVFPLP